MIRNATPMHYMDGVKDESIERVYPAPKGLAQFQPLLISHAEKGPYGEFEGTGQELIKIFGSETFNPLSKYSTPQSLYANKILQSGGQVSFIRLPHATPDFIEVGLPSEPFGVDGIANMAYYLVVSDLVTRKPFLRDVDGTVKLDRNGVPIEDLTAPDIQVRYAMITSKYITNFTTDNPTLTSMQIAGGLDINGTLVNITAYPILVVPAEAHGSYYKNVGFSITTTDDSEMIAKGMFPFQFSLYDKSSGRVRVHTTNLEANGVKFTFRPDSVHPLTGASVTFEDLIPHDFGNYTNSDYEIKPYTIGDVTLYRADIDRVTYDILDRELAGYNGVLPSYSDFWSFDMFEMADQQYLSNFIDFKHSNGAPYEYTRYSYDGALTAAAVELIGKRVVSNTSTPTFLEGGWDGDVENKQLFEDSVVSTLVGEFGDTSSKLNDMAVSKFSTFIDTGFSITAKTEFGVIFTKRKDLNLIAATYTVNVDNELQDYDEAVSVAAVLNSMYAIYSESEEYQTPNFRYCIIAGSGKTRTENYRYHLPLTYDFAVKNARMFGAGNGAWNTVYEFSSRGGNEITEQVDIYPNFTPDDVKNTLWINNLIWAQNKDKQTWIYPGMQTGYNDDTSVLNGWYSVIADGYAQKVLNETFLYLVGDQTMTRAQFKDEFESYANRMLTGKFGNIIVAKPVLYYTKEDEQRGYSAHAYIELYIPNMKTVIKSHVVTKRIDNLQ